MFSRLTDMSNMFYETNRLQFNFNMFSFFLENMYNVAPSRYLDDK